ncbi:glycosyltransferase family 57 protein [Hypholoma sublateritium FD-334 SS-4]|uniref:Alpha-1,3-glucosyltransferase n=1 Tax=Hypholoma sublateritium (strain FD-334 SS-4) TaxID=945553 RepID=A0A0D2NXI0_HYPSF|nr:glycosyltransferase family 57 protein [Hypholoma sublateritium FD-334 SS-4]
MDELSVLPPEGSWKRSARVRTSSLNPRYAYTNPSPSSTRAESPFRPNSLSSNTNGIQSDTPLILAPTPQRHLIESSASQRWLNTPPMSATSSRPSSPQAAFSQSSAYPTTRIRRRLSSNHTRSFSALLAAEKSEQVPVLPSLRGGLHRVSGRGLEPEETGGGRRWIRWMHKRGIKTWVVPGVIAGAALLKFAIGLGSYSGQNTPPMFGDYEAQRHWMELTIHLPMNQWYTYDLPYWGLDYPPLTAYISWLCGIVAHFINPSWVGLDNSRGIETPESKFFMRMTVIACDALVYVPALVMFAHTWQGSRSKRTQELSLLTLILQPALLLVDCGHFQYNSVMLGFTILALNFFAKGQDLIGAAFFVLSLGFKQMALYYAPAFGSYLLAKCLYLGPTKGGQLFVRLALVTASTFLLLFLPWLSTSASLSTIMQPVTRIFPFARGLFEDKVSNFWCASNVIFKWKTWASSASLVKTSTALTALGFLPAVAGLLRSGITHMTKSELRDEKDSEGKQHTPFLPLLPYALLTSSMSFFLFSFQVHEKTILLPLLPVTLLLSGAPIDSAAYSWGALVNNVAVFSMWPLLKRDGLGLQYIATLLLWNRVIGYSPFKLPVKSFVQLLSMGVYAAAILLHILESIVHPPARYPDLFPVLNVLISTPVFFLTWSWSIKCGMEVGWALGGLGNQSHSPPVLDAKEVEDVGGVTAQGTGVLIPPSNTTLSYRQAGGRTVSLGRAQSSGGSSSKATASTSPADLFEGSGSMGGGGEAD